MAASEQCQQCPALRQENAVLRGQVRALEELVRHLRRQFGSLIAGVSTTIDMIVREREEPTLPRGQLVPAVIERLQLLVNLATRERL